MTADSKKIMTVLGPIAPEDAGITLVHEHLTFNLSCLSHMGGGADAPSFAAEPVAMEHIGALRRNSLCMADNAVVLDTNLLVSAALEYKKRGGATIVDVTLADIGRDAASLKEISERTGLHVVAGAGHYIHLTHPSSLQHESVEQITERMLDEVANGIEATGVRPGILGEIGTTSPLHPSEIKVLRAAARVSAQTGIAVTLHMDPNGHLALDVLDILEAEGADPGRIVVGHVDLSINRDDAIQNDPIWYIRKVIERGAYVALDTFGSETWYADGLSSGQKAFMLPNDQQRIFAVLKIIEEGNIDQLLISQDICLKTTHVKYGGFGYGYILEYIAPQLRAYGITQVEIDKVLISNPMNMLAY